MLWNTGMYICSVNKAVQPVSNVAYFSHRLSTLCTVTTFYFYLTVMANDFNSNAVSGELCFSRQGIKKVVIMCVKKRWVIVVNQELDSLGLMSPFDLTPSQ